MLELHIIELIWEACCNAIFDPHKQISHTWANLWLLIWTFQTFQLYKTALDILWEKVTLKVSNTSIFRDARITTRMSFAWHFA